ncbi:MAG TPA: type II toxin-antitoxin system VapC family toxin [Candidatus Acidoferrales bacterium]|nr:type II toxin-antitoxin system VapC family toxin [Candidatus Acidoferrales bacterium]
MNKTYVLDASAVLSLLMNASGANRVDQLLREALRLKSPLAISAVNWGEVFYLSWQRHGEQTARQTIADLSRLPIRVVSVDSPQVLKAGQLKAVHKIPYVDCFAAALALQQNATLVTSDRDFEKLGRHFPILWIGRT